VAVDGVELSAVVKVLAVGEQAAGVGADEVAAGVGAGEA